MQLEFDETNNTWTEQTSNSNPIKEIGNTDTGFFGTWEQLQLYHVVVKPNACDSDGTLGEHGVGNCDS